LLRYANAISIHAIDDIDDCVSVGVVASPVWPDARLSTEVPDLKLEVLVLDCLHVEANCYKPTTS